MQQLLFDWPESKQFSWQALALEIGREDVGAQTVQKKMRAWNWRMAHCKIPFFFKA